MTESHQIHPQQQQTSHRETRSSKTKEMIKAIPPSPALSHAEMPVHGQQGRINDYLQQQHFYPQEQQQQYQQQQQHQLNMESIHSQSAPGSRYSTPVQPRALYQPSSHQQQLLPQYPQYSYP